MRFSLVFLALFSFSIFSCQKEVAKKPNILFILTDDQGWGDMTSHGNDIIETPNLDLLSKNGAEFDRFYVSPLCAPTRASLLTGRYHLKTGATSVSNGLEIMDAEEETIAEVFKSNGYKTGIFGKWHNGSHYPNRPTDQGFDEFIGFCAGHWSNYFDTKLDSNNTEIQSTGFITDYLTDKAIDFIDRNKEEPFLCYVPYNAPHSPFQVPDSYFDKYKAKGLDDGLASIYGMVDNVDFNIGRLLEKLQNEGLAENTIVIFMSDNGPNGTRYNGEMKGVKGHVDEGGVRVPSIINWPNKITKGRKIDGLTAHIDWLPTLKELCGIEQESKKGIDGISLANVLLNEETEIPEREIFSHVAFLDKDLKDNPGALRTGENLMVFKGKSPELYSLDSDPSQKSDISEDNTPLTQNLYTKYLSWFKDASKNYQSVKPIAVNTDYIELPAYEAQFSGNLKYEEGHGWAHDWLKNWTSTADEMRWLVNATEETELNAYLIYNCPEESIGAVIKVKIGTSDVTKSLTEAFEGTLIDSPDRITRKEAYEKTWSKMKIGNIKIPKGTNNIVLSALSIPKSQVAEVKAIILSKE
ncbi:arylsulfatase [uncultured Arcticibacterium sp.]|uniref:arylsulfatase n=1 Tax=uncultured Arcticibacterium sp. TaxID=2173042 RepID=UPI0030F71C4E